MAAALCGHDEVVQTLLDAGADAAATNKVCAPCPWGNACGAERLTVPPVFAAWQDGSRSRQGWAVRECLRSFPCADRCARKHRRPRGC